MIPATSRMPRADGGFTLMEVALEAGADDVTLEG